MRLQSAHNYGYFTDGYRGQKIINRNIDIDSGKSKNNYKEWLINEIGKFVRDVSNKYGVNTDIKFLIALDKPLDITVEGIEDPMLASITFLQNAIYDHTDKYLPLGHTTLEIASGEDPNNRYGIFAYWFDPNVPVVKEAK